MKSVKLGFVGCGMHGSFLQSLVRKVPALELVAVCDIDRGIPGINNQLGVLDNHVIVVDRMIRRDQNTVERFKESRRQLLTLHRGKIVMPHLG